MNDLKSWLVKCQSRIAQVMLKQLESRTGIAPKLMEAMQYACSAGGKCIRPALVYAVNEAFGGQPVYADSAAAAVEFLHVYSLIHDDLPAMDNDELRRGQPTCHMVFGQAGAILAGDALQSLAFEVLSDGLDVSLSARQKLFMIETLAKASGVQGMAAGQSLDLEMTGNGGHIDRQLLDTIHLHKTAQLIKASMLMGATAAGVENPESLEALGHFGQWIGLAFQVQDDILDVVGSTEQLGKRQGADKALFKATYPAVVGLEESRQQLQKLYFQAVKYLDLLDVNTDRLKQIAQYLVTRTF